MLWLTDTRIPAEPSGARRARAVIDALGLRLSRERRDDLRLLTTETVTNAVRHGSPVDRAPDPLIRLRVGVDGDRLRLEVHDGGPGFVPADRDEHSSLGSGWGVHFVEHLTERWGTRRDHGTWIVWFELPLDGQAGGCRHPARAATCAA